MSQTGVDSFFDNDDDGTADVDVAEDAINWATTELMFYLHERYDIADLSDTSLGAELVNRWCVLGAFKYGNPRGNPPPEAVEVEWEKVVVKLEQIRSDEASLPGIAIRAQQIPTLSNRTIDRRYRRSKIRVTRANSSDAPSKLPRDFSRDFGTDLEG